MENKVAAIPVFSKVNELCKWLCSTKVSDGTIGNSRERKLRGRKMPVLPVVHGDSSFFVADLLPACKAELCANSFFVVREQISSPSLYRQSCLFNTAMEPARAAVGKRTGLSGEQLC